MRILAFLICLSVTCSFTRAESLSEAERKALVDELTKIKESADRRVDARFRTAMRAYNQAMASNEAVLDFYLKCVEKVNFTDKLKDPKEFRDWKEKQEATLADPAFKLAMRYQLRWLSLMLEATSKNADKERLAVEAASFVDTIFSDFSAVQTQSTTLRQSVMGTVFAKAYEIDSVDVKWPGSPVDVGSVYEKVILPALRRPTLTSGLRNAWMRRIQLEKINACSWINKKTELTTKEGRRDREKERDVKEVLHKEKTVKEEQFDTETQPDLIWQMEVDLFKNGDEVSSASRMMSHINSRLTHPSSRQWADQLQQLLIPPTAPVETTPTPTPTP